MMNYKDIKGVPLKVLIDELKVRGIDYKVHRGFMEIPLNSIFNKVVIVYFDSTTSEPAYIVSCAVR